MLVSGEEYSKRLETFSDDTLRLIMATTNTRATYKKASLIIRETDNSEEEVARKLKELQATTSTKTEAQE